MNASETPDNSPLAYLMTTEGQNNTGMLVAGLADAVVSIVYALRHLKTSQCCGFSCEQEVVDAPHVVVCPDGKPAIVQV